MSVVVQFDAAAHMGMIPYMAVLHATCINSDKTISTFIPPLSNDRLLQWWKDRVAEVARNERAIFLLLTSASASTTASASAPARLIGLVQLSLRPTSSSETGLHRATVETLLVGAEHRGRGGARQLMDALEAEAHRKGRFLLLLDTMTNTPNSVVFEKLGFKAAGVIPAFSLSPNGEHQDSTIFYKNLSY